MTATERHACASRLVELTAARSGKTLTADQVTGLIELLDDLPWSAVEPALEASARDDAYFPRVPAIRARVRVALDRAARQRAASGLAAIREGEIHCRVCDDTGWQIRFAPSSYDRDPAVQRSYASPCPCRATNPIYQAKRAAGPSRAEPVS